MATVVAEEISNRSKPRDRPSRAAITIQLARSPFRLRRGRRLAVKITAPVMDGEQLVEVTFTRDGFISSSEPLQYDAMKNIGAAVICVEGFVQSNGKFPRAKMHTLDDSGEILSKPWFDWSLNPDYWPDSEKEWSLETKLQHIFKVLLVDR